VANKIYSGSFENHIFAFGDRKHSIAVEKSQTS